MAIELQSGFQQSVESLINFIEKDTTANQREFDRLVSACRQAQRTLQANNEPLNIETNTLFQKYSLLFPSHQIVAAAFRAVKAYQVAYNACLQSIQVTEVNGRLTTVSHSDKEKFKKTLQTTQKTAQLAVAKLQNIDHPQAPDIKNNYKVLFSSASALNLSSGKTSSLLKKLVSKTYSALKTTLPLLALTASAVILSKSFGNEVPYEKMARVGRVTLDTTTDFFFQNVPTLFIHSANMVTEGGTRLGNALQSMGTRLLIEKSRIQETIDFVPNSPLSQKVFAAGTLTAGISHLLDKLGLRLNLRIPGTRQSFSLVRTVKRVATAAALTPFLVGGYLAFSKPPVPGAMPSSISTLSTATTLSLFGAAIATPIGIALHLLKEKFNNTPHLQQQLQNRLTQIRTMARQALPTVMIEATVALGVVFLYSTLRAVNPLSLSLGTVIGIPIGRALHLLKEKFNNSLERRLRLEQIEQRLRNGLDLIRSGRRALSTALTQIRTMGRRALPTVMIRSSLSFEEVRNAGCLRNQVRGQNQGQENRSNLGPSSHANFDDVD